MATDRRAISVRLDGDALSALDELARNRRLTRSQAIRESLVETAGRAKRRSMLAAEARGLAADEADRAEMAEVGALMESLRGPG